MAAIPLKPLPAARAATAGAGAAVLARGLAVGRADAAVAAALGVASLAVTVPRALGYALWQDEVGAARPMVNGSFDGMLHAVASVENHPPGYYALGWLVHQAGVPVVWERAVSVAATALLASLVYLTARRLMSVLPAALAGLAIVLGWQFEKHGWELRPYALFALANVAAVLALRRAALRPTLRRCSVLAAAVATAALLHDYFVLTAAAGALWLFVSPVVRARRRVLASIAAGYLPLLLWAPGVLDQYRHRRYATLPGFDGRSIVDLYADLLERHVVPGARGLALSLAVLVLVLYGAARLWRDPGLGRLCALAATVPVAAASVLWALGPHVFAPRALIGVLPFAAIAIAAAVAAPRPPFALAAAPAAALLLAAGYARADGRIVPDYDRVAAALVAEGWHEEDPIVLFGSTYDYLIPLDWYLPGADRLEIAAPTGGGCGEVFVVAVDGRGAALAGGSRRVRHTLIGSTPWRARLWAEVERRGGVVLGTRRSACLRLVAR